METAEPGALLSRTSPGSKLHLWLGSSGCGGRHGDGHQLGGWSLTYPGARECQWTETSLILYLARASGAQEMQETVLDPYVRRQAVALKAGLAQAQQVCEQVLCCGQVLLPAVGSCGSGGGGALVAVTAGPGWGSVGVGLAGECWGAALRSTEWWALGAVETWPQCTRAHLRSIVSGAWAKKGLKLCSHSRKASRRGCWLGARCPSVIPRP